MILRELQSFLKTCPSLSGREININYLGHREGDCSLDEQGDYTVLRTYCDGERIVSRRFALGLRSAFDENAVLNMKDCELLEEVAQWLIINVPYIAIDKMPYLAESSVQGARLQLEFTLTYRENKEGILW